MPVTYLDPKLKVTDTHIPLSPAVLAGICSPLSPHLLSNQSLTAAITTAAAAPALRAASCGTIPEALAQIENRDIAIFVDVLAKMDNKIQTDELIQILRDNESFITRNRVDIYKFNDALSA